MPVPARHVSQGGLQTGTRPSAGFSRGPRAQQGSIRTQAASGFRMSDMSRQMKEMRGQLESDDQLKSLMAGLRGANVDDSDFADKDVVMQLVEVDRDEQDQLPQVYNPELIAEYWGRRPVAVARRITQLLGISWGFLSKLGWDIAQGQLKKHEVARAIEMRQIVTSLGPAYIKLGQALSIRPDLLSPAAMVEMQKLCDKVPSFDSNVAMEVVRQEFGAPWHEVFAELSPEPIAAASLGQVYRGRLHSGEDVAVKVQRPYILETVTVDLFVIRRIFNFIKRFKGIHTDFVALLDEWAMRFFEELDYVHEGENGTAFANSMHKDLPQVVVPATFPEFTTRRVLTTSWLNGEKLSQSKADDVAQLVNLGVVCYLKQLLDTGFFHADPHPGNLIRTPEGRLAILDFGLMSQVDDNIKYGMIEAISHLIHRDYSAIVEDFVTLDFIPKGTDLSPILPVLAKVFDQALEGGGAKNINFQELAADLAQITFDYPFRIPPYFALIIRAISVLEGIALTGDPDFALVDEAYPYIAKRLLTDRSPRLQAALRYMIYGKNNTFDADRLIDLLGAFETFRSASTSASGDSEAEFTLPTGSAASSQTARQQSLQGASTSAPSGPTLFPFPFSLPLPQFPLPFPPLFPEPHRPAPVSAFSSGGSSSSSSSSTVPCYGQPAIGFTAAYPDPARGTARATPGQAAHGSQAGTAREALKFVLSAEGAFFREFLMNELVVSIDGLSRLQVASLVERLGLQAVMLPLLLPGTARPSFSLAPEISEADRLAVDNIVKISDFLTGGSAKALLSQNSTAGWQVVQELAPYLPALASEILPEVGARLLGRISARLLRLAYV